MQPIIDDPPGRLCLIRLSAIGDVCHTVPVVRAIQDAWPETEITWLIGRAEHGLVAGLERVRFGVLDKWLGWRAYLKLRSELERREFPLLLHMHASQRANLASLLVSAPIRLGFDRARARDMQHWFCNRHLAPRASRHVMDGLFEFAEALGIERGEPRWDIPVAAADAELAASVLDAERPSLVISPCTGQRFRNYRNWRPERFAAVADHAHRRYGARIVLTGGTTPLERSYADAILAATRCEPVDLVGRTSLKQLLCVLERASVVLCPDSGPAHMATAVHTPVVGLYATSNPLRTGPYASQHLVVDRYPDAVRREFGVDVERIRWGRRVRDPNAMDLITVDDVLDKLERAFAERGIGAVNAV